MAKRGGWFRNVLHNLFPAFVSKQPQDEPQRERERPESERRPVRFTDYDIPLSDNTYRVILKDRGAVWFRPVFGQDDSMVKGYVINMQGFLRGGSRKHSAGWFGDELRNLEGERLDGELEDGTPITQAELETSLRRIEETARIENLIGDGWKSG